MRSLDIHVVSNSFITLNYLFKLITKIRLSNNYFRFINIQFDNYVSCQHIDLELQ